MCGLYGYRTARDFRLSKTKQQKRRAIVEALAISMEKRGTDSTGIAAINNGKCHIAKNVGSSRVVIRQAEAKKAMESNPEIIIGHTRFATVGAINKKNAHPFRRGSIVGTHNGHVSNYYEIDASVDVDSEVIFSELKKHKNDYVKAFERLSGQFAIVWSDIETENLFLVRDGNPLSMVYVPRLKTIFWCSEEMPLHSIVYAVMGADSFAPIAIEEELVYTFDSKLKRTTDDVSFHYPVYNYEQNADTGKYVFEGMTQEEIEEMQAEAGLIEEVECQSCNEPVFENENMYIDAHNNIYCAACAVEISNYIEIQPFTPIYNQ